MDHRKALVLISLLLVVATGCAQRVLVQPVVDTARYQRLAVLPFETESFLSTVGSQLADEVVIALLKNAPDLELVERARVDALMQEQNLARGSYLDPRTAVALGKLLGVQALVAGSVTVSLGNIQPTTLTAQRVANGAVTVRIIDVETGKVLWGDRREASSTDFLRTEPGYGAGGVRTDHELVQRVLQELGQAVARSFYPHFEYR